MRFQLLGEWGMIYFQEPQRPLGFVLLAIYGVILVALLVRIAFDYIQRRREFMGTWTNKLLWLTAWLVLSGVLANTLVVEWPAGDISRDLSPGREAVALLAWIPIVFASAQLGAGGALLTGLVSGWVSGAYDTARLTHIFEIGIFGLIATLLLYQDYKGRLGAILRQPLIAIPWAGLTVWALGVFSIYAYTHAELSTLSAINNSLTVAVANLPGVLIKSLFAGGALQIAYALLPELRAVQTPTRIPPYARSVSLRFLFFFLPAATFTLVIILYAMMAQALRIATDQTIDQIAHVARNVSIELPFFPWTGQSLLSWISTDTRLQSPEYVEQEKALREGMTTMPFFNQIALVTRDEVSPNGESKQLALRIVGAPPESQMELMVTDEEMERLKLTLRDGSTQITPVHKNWNGDPIISFIVPVESRLIEGEIVGALIGRVRIADNFQLRSMLNNLQPPGDGKRNQRNQGIGFLIDERNRIVVHPNTARILDTWTVNPAPLLTHPTDDPLALAYQDRDPVDGSRQLVYVLRTEGVQWRIVVIRPYENVLTQATEISSPLLILFLIAGIIGSVSVPIFTARLTRPLQQLSQAAREIADNRLDIPVEVSGEDEVGQLGRSFEQMRQRLQERMSELSLLLEISQQVSASIGLEPSLLPILKGATQATGGVAARMVLLDAHGVRDQAINYGQSGDEHALARLDMVVDTVVKRNKELVINDITYTGHSTLVDLLRVGIRAVIGIPLRLQDRVSGVLWVCYRQARSFEESDLRFLYTLAGQAAVVAENARLFEGVQEEQNRLKAILNSTNDVVIVVDGQGRIILSNPAARQTYGLDPRDVIGKPARQVIADQALLALLSRPMEEESALTDEVHAPDGRTFSASVSSLSTGGRVVTLRDITYLKELDQMKSDFVNTVSHDLRSPLTYMRGYTTMISMVGPVNEKQQGFIDKILSGIEQMTGLIDDLLDIGKIEAGIGFEPERCWLPGVIQAVLDDLGTRAAEKQIQIGASLPADTPPTMADNTLIRQAIHNLVDNAIKYTNGPGRVDVSVVQNDNFLIIRVRDTGIGIAAEHQHHLFEKFYRIKRRDTVHIKGTGLGLAIVKSIAERHNGRVWVESKLGEGSSFYLAIPLVPPPADPRGLEDL